MYNFSINKENILLTRMDGVPLIVVNDKDGLDNIDDTIEIVEEGFDGKNNLSVHRRLSSIRTRSLLSFMANRSQSRSSSVESVSEYGEELIDGRKVFLSLFAALIIIFVCVFLALWNY